LLKCIGKNNCINTKQLGTKKPEVDLSLLSSEVCNLITVHFVTGLFCHGVQQKV